MATILDETANNFDATTVGDPTFGTGVDGASIIFNGTDQYLTIADDAGLKNANFSIACWVKMPTSSSVQMLAIVYSQDPNVAGFTFHIRDTGRVRLLVGGNTGSLFTTDYDIADSTTSVDDGGWHHVVGTYDGTDIKVYVDGGAAEVTTNYTNGCAYDTTSYIRVGAIKSTTAGAETNFYNGEIDELKLFSRALSEAEIQLLYESTTLSVITDYVASWTMDDIVSTTLNDETGNYDGTITGAVVADGVIGNDALSFDGVDDRVFIPYNAAFRPLTVSVSLWVNTTQDITSATDIIGNQQDNIPGWSGWRLAMVNGVVTFFTGADIGSTLGAGVDYSGTPNKTNKTYIAKGVWTHIIGIQSGNTQSIYIDGELMFQISTPTMAYSSGNIGTAIGARTNNNTTFARFLDGEVDDIRVFDRVVDAAEIQALYQTGVPAVPTDYALRFSFDDADISGSTITDLSVNGLDGTLVNAPTTVTADLKTSAQAMVFDGVNQRITVADNVLIEPSAITISLWFNADAFDGAVQVIAANYARNPTNLTGWQIALHTNAAGNYFYCIMGNNTGNTDNVSRWSVLSPDYQSIAGWHHIAFTYDNVSTLTLYIDGAFVGENTTASTGSLSFTADTKFVIGDRTADAGSTYTTPFAGRVDDFRQYNRALSSAEISAIYKENRPYTEALNDFIAQYTFDDGAYSGTTVYDTTGNHNATAISGATLGSTGIVGQGVNVNQASQYISIPDDAEFQNSRFTCAGWFQLDTSADATSRVMVSNYSRNTNHAGYYWYWQASNNNRIVCSFGSNTGAVNLLDYFNISINWENSVGQMDGKWFHVVLVGANRSVAIFVNGTLAGIRGMWNPVDWAATNYIQLGAGNLTGAPWVAGLGNIDEVTFYNRAVTRTEIWEMYTKVKGVAEPLPTPVANWTCRLSDNPNPTTTLVDTVGGYNGTFVGGGSVSSGKMWGGSITLDGVDDHVTIAQNVALEPANFTIAAYIRREGTNVDTAHDIFQNYSTGNLVSGYNLFLYETGELRGVVGGKTGSVLGTDYDVIDSVGANILENQWTFVAMTYDGSTVRIYRGDTIVAEKAYSNGIGYDPTNRCLIGSRFNDTVNYRFFNGSIHNLKFYNTALTEAQISELTRDRPEPTDYVGRWDLGEYGSTTVTDLSGNGNDGTLVGGAVVGIKDELAVNSGTTFNGSTQWVEITEAAIIKPTPSICVSMWFKGSSAGGESIFSADRRVGATDTGGFLMYLNTDGHARFYIYSATGNVLGTDYDFAASNYPVNDGEWHHLVGWYDGADIRIYVGSHNNTTTAYAGGLVYQSDTRFRIGSRNRLDAPGEAQQLDGSVRDVRIYDRLLSGQEIQAIHANGVFYD